MSEPRQPRTEAGRALLTELSESPLPGARYAHDVVSRRILAIEDEAASETPRETALRRLRAALASETPPREGLREALERPDDESVASLSDLDAAVVALAHWTEADWREVRGGDSIARTINAVRDIILAARPDPVVSEGPSEDWVLGWSTGHLAASEGLREGLDDAIHALSGGDLAGGLLAVYAAREAIGDA